MNKPSDKSSRRLRSRAGLFCLTAMALVSASAPAILYPGDAAAQTSPQVKVIQTTASLSKRMARLPDLAFSPAPPAGLTITVRDQLPFQTIAGFGASMTDSSAKLLNGLRAGARNEVLGRLFGTRGIGLDFLRVPIGASDFTAGGKPYSYDDVPTGHSDPSLRHFSIGHDNKYILPVLRRTRDINPHLELLANTWSPPAWMKTNNSLDSRNSRGAKGTLRPSAYGPFAHYIVRFLAAYARAGVRIDAITPQNEPGTLNELRDSVLQPSYPGMVFGVADQSRFISQYLHPALQHARLSTTIFGGDGSWNLLGSARFLLRHTGTSLTGIAWHCYFGTPVSMRKLHALDPLEAQIVDECSSEIRPFTESEFLISSLRNWAGTVADWNLALNPQGGPVEPPNTGCYECTGIITVNPRTGSVGYGLKYFQMGQVSAMVKRGARRIASNSFVRYSGAEMMVSQGIDDVAFRNPDGTCVLVVYNNSRRRLRFDVDAPDRGTLSTTIAARATDTLVWR